MTHGLRAIDRVCGQWCEVPEREKQRRWRCVNGTQTYFGLMSSQPVVLSPGGHLAVSGESLTVSAWGQVRVGVGGCLWNPVGRGQRTVSTAEIVPAESVVLRLGVDINPPKDRIFCLVHLCITNGT